MPLNTTVSHISPLVSYIPRSAWYEADSSDPDLDKYSNKSYHYSNSSASVTFSWWGTGIWVFGGRRSWSGEYTVSVDNQPAQTFPAYEGGEDEFQQVLFAAPDHTFGNHQIRITNTGSNPASQSTLDIDYIVYETTLAAELIVQHNDPGCSWMPKNQNAWMEDDTSHTTHDALGSMELSFTVCSGITLYGTLEKNSAPLSVSVDGWASTPVAPNTDIDPLVSGVVHVLYTKSNLDEGQHTLRVENNPLSLNGSGSRMSLSYTQILTFSEGELSKGNPAPSGESNSRRRTVVLAASFSALGAFLLSILVWRLAVCYHSRKRSRKELIAPRPFYARTNPQSPPQSPRPRQRPGRQRRWPRDNEDPEARTAILSHTTPRTPTTRWTRRPAHRRPPSDIEFARSWASSKFDSEGGVDAHTYGHGHSRSYDDFGYPRTATYAYPDDAIRDSELTFLRHTRNTSATSSSAPSHTVRDSFSMHATAPTSPATPVFDHGRPPPPIPLTLPSRVNSGRQQQRRHRSIEKPPLDVEEQLAIFASASNARRAGVEAGAGMRLVGSPATSLPSSRPSTATGTGTGTGVVVPRPLPPPPVPPVPSHLRDAPLRSPSQGAFDLWDMGMGQPPPYRLLDMH